MNCTENVHNTWGPHFEKHILEDFGSREYSLLIDEGSDVSVTKLTRIVI
jgi:hypothetical protein